MAASNPNAPIRVLIVEDHQMVAEMTARMLRDEADIEVIGYATTVAGAEAEIANNGADVVLMDYKLPDGNGISAAASIREQHPQTRVIIFTGSADDRLLKDALQAGCSGYICKTEHAANLALAIRAAHAGSTAVSPEMLSRAIAQTAPVRNASGSSALSARELDVLRQLCQGKNRDEIAEILFLSQHTVRNHIQNILEKLECHSMLEAVTKALREGLVEL